MRQFFFRIFLAVWMILTATAVATVIAAKYTLAGGNQLLQPAQAQKLVDMVARNYSLQLATAKPADHTGFLNNNILDYGSLLQIYLVDAQGREILGRKLPPQVYKESICRRCIYPEAQYVDGPFRVIGVQRNFILGRALMLPGGRLLLLVIALTTTALASFWLARFIVRPVTELRAAGQAVAAGDLDVRVSGKVVGRQDDIAQLARDFDHMTNRIRQLLASRDQLMRDVSHELRSPLARLQAIVSLIRQRESCDTQLRVRMEMELERLDQLIGEILTYSRLQQQSAQYCTVNLGELLEVIAHDAEFEGSQKTVSVHIDIEQPSTVTADYTLLYRALENVLRNAVEHAPKSSTVTADLRAEDSDVVIRVRDTGRGVSPVDLPHLFEPFYRGAGNTKPGGIGLAIAKRSVEIHGGSIEAENHSEGGLEVTLKLPVQPPGLEGRAGT
jgi:signal transduction histidine kinase